jgi:hypothetical protein
LPKRSVFFSKPPKSSFFEISPANFVSTFDLLNSFISSSSLCYSSGINFREVFFICSASISFRLNEIEGSGSLLGAGTDSTD